MKSKSDTNIGNIELAPGKYLYTENEFVNTANPDTWAADVEAALGSWRKKVRIYGCDRGVQRRRSGQ